MGRMKTLWKSEEGQAMVEAAITMPIFLFIICGIMELSYMFIVQSVVDYSAYCACRSGIVHNGDPKIMEWAASQALAPVTQSAISPVSLRQSRNGWFGQMMGQLGAATLARYQFETDGGIVRPYGSYTEYFWESMQLSGERRIRAIVSMNDAFPINRMRILDPASVIPNFSGDTSNPYGTHTWMDQNIHVYWDSKNPQQADDNFYPPAGGYLLAREPRAAELGEDADGAPYRWRVFLGKGIRLTSTNADDVKKLRLRVEIIHSHRMMFSFLVPMAPLFVNPLTPSGDNKYWRTGVNVGTYGNLSDDEKYRNATSRIFIRSECTMRMQSNFMKPPLPDKDHPSDQGPDQ